MMSLCLLSSHFISTTTEHFFVLKSLKVLGYCSHYHAHNVDTSSTELHVCTQADLRLSPTICCQYIWQYSVRQYVCTIEVSRVLIWAHRISQERLSEITFVDIDSSLWRVMHFPSTAWYCMTIMYGYWSVAIPKIKGRYGWQSLLSIWPFWTSTAMVWGKNSFTATSIPLNSWYFTTPNEPRPTKISSSDGACPSDVGLVSIFRSIICRYDWLSSILWNL